MSDQDASSHHASLGGNGGSGGLCPLPGSPLSDDAITSNLSHLLVEAGCPLAPAIQQRQRFETFLAELSATFVHLPASQIDSRIDQALQRLVEFLGMDRGGLAELLIAQKQMVITHSYHVPGAPPQSRTILTEQLPWYTRTILQGEVLRLARIPEDLPPVAIQEREYCTSIGMKSHVMIPLRVMDSVVGAIGFASFRRNRDWPEALIQRLRLVGEIFANALARKHAEEKVDLLRDQLARVARATAVGELTSTIAHEVNQPLCAIISNAQAAQRLLANDAANLDEMREILQDITADSRRASEVIVRIRSLLQKREPARVPLDLNNAIRDVVSLTQQQLMRRGVTLSLDLADGLPLALGDSVQLQQVVLNLLFNALEAASSLGSDRHEVAISSVLNATGDLDVTVRDSGPGVPPEHVDRVFEAFFTTKPGGMGIGLAISRSIIEAHGGRIWIDPGVGDGASFCFTLPTLKESQP